MKIKARFGCVIWITYWVCFLKNHSCAQSYKHCKSWNFHLVRLCSRVVGLWTTHFNSSLQYRMAQTNHYVPALDENWFLLVIYGAFFGDGWKVYHIVQEPNRILPFMHKWSNFRFSHIWGKSVCVTNSSEYPLHEHQNLDNNSFHLLFLTPKKLLQKDCSTIGYTNKGFLFSL